MDRGRPDGKIGERKHMDTFMGVYVGATILNVIGLGSYCLVSIIEKSHKRE